MEKKIIRKVTLEQLERITKKVINEMSQDVIKYIEPRNDEQYFSIDMPVNSSDHTLFANVVNQGIDAYLEGFTKSEFGFKKYEDGSHRAVFNFHKDEVDILLRRLEEIWNNKNDEEAYSWMSDIKSQVLGEEDY